MALAARVMGWEPDREACGERRAVGWVFEGWGGGFLCGRGGVDDIFLGGGFFLGGRRGKRRMDWFLGGGWGFLKGLGDGEDGGVGECWEHGVR